MMGGFQSNMTNARPEVVVRRPARAFATAFASTLLGTFLATLVVPPLVPIPLVLPAGPVAAGPAETAHARVSTSPDEHAATAIAPPPSPLAGVASDGEDPTPLTRAAARRRVESISPVPWLARFGPVSLERRE